MKAYQKIISHALLLSLASTSYAALAFNIDGIGSLSTATPSAGAISGTDVDGVVNTSVTTNATTAGGADESLDGAASGFITVSLTSLTLDGVGVDDDSAILTFAISAGSDTIDDNGSEFGVEGAGLGRLNTTSEFLTLSYVSASSSVTLGAGATEAGTVEFLGFNRVDLFQFGGDDVGTISFGGGSATNFSTDPYDFAVETDDLTLGLFAADAGNAGYKLADFRARFRLDTVAVPEPSSYALIFSLASLALVVAGRRGK